MTSRPILRFFRLVCLSLWLAPVASGQEGSTERGGAWFVASAIPEQVENPIQVLAGGEVHEVTLSKRSVGGPVKIPGDGRIQVVRPIPDPENPEEIAYQTLAVAQVEDGVKDALVILVPAAQQTEDGRVFVASVVDLAGFRGGDYLFLNLSPLGVAIQMGEERKIIAPGRMEISRGGGGDEAVAVPVSYHFQDRASGQWRLISASTVARMPSRRELCLFSWDPRTERISYHGVTFPVSP